MSNIILFPVAPRRIPIAGPWDLTRACAAAARGCKIWLDVDGAPDNIRVLPVVRIEREENVNV